MTLKGPEHYYISAEQEKELGNDLPTETKYSFNLLKEKHGYTGRMSEFVKYLTEIFGIKEFEFFDSYTWNKAEFLSYLLDRLIEYKNGKTLDKASFKYDIVDYDDESEEIKIIGHTVKAFKERKSASNYFMA